MQGWHLGLFLSALHLVPTHVHRSIGAERVIPCKARHFLTGPAGGAAVIPEMILGEGPVLGIFHGCAAPVFREDILFLERMCLF